MRKERIEEIRKELEEGMKYSTMPHTTGLMSMVLLLEILDTLSSIDEKLDAVNINIIDVENEVSKLTP